MEAIQTARWHSSIPIELSVQASLVQQFKLANFKGENLKHGIIHQSWR